MLKVVRGAVGLSHHACKRIYVLLYCEVFAEKIVCFRASDNFEKTKMFTWMMENAEDYGFILRYPKDKIDVTGVIYESWHWRFVGINTAKEINEMGVTLEEYVEIKKIDWKSELN